MALVITKSSDPIEVKNIKVMLYGQPGVGKTSTAFTASNVLLLDCDNGAYRSGFRKDAVQVDSWKDIAGISPEDIKAYDTIAIDTVGRLLDFLAADIMRGNSKMGYNGALSLQGYGQLKSQFAQWVKTLGTMGKDIVMIAHDKEDKRGDEVAIRPDIQGGSYGEVFKIADSVGYMYRGEQGNVLDFNPSTRWEGKNVAGLAPIQIPDYRVEPDFFAGVISGIKASMNALSAEGKMIADMVAHERKAINAIDTADGLNNAVDKVAGLLQQAQNPVKKIIMDRAKVIGIQFDKQAKRFIQETANDASQPVTA